MRKPLLGILIGLLLAIFVCFVSALHRQHQANEIMKVSNPLKPDEASVKTEGLRGLGQLPKPFEFHTNRDVEFHRQVDTVDCSRRPEKTG
jgi:hypothetical protein